MLSPVSPMPFDDSSLPLKAAQAKQYFWFWIILRHILNNLRRDYTTVGLMEDLPTSMVLFQHAVGDNAFCNQTGFLEMATYRRANAHKHKEMSRNSTEYARYQQYFWLDELLYEAVQILYQEQVQKARQIPALAAQLDELVTPNGGVKED